MNFTKNIEEEKPIKIAPKKKYELVDKIDYNKIVGTLQIGNKTLIKLFWMLVPFTPLIVETIGAR
jgi:hypothetical protein